MLMIPNLIICNKYQFLLLQPMAGVVEFHTRQPVPFSRPHVLSTTCPYLRHTSGNDGLAVAYLSYCIDIGGWGPLANVPSNLGHVDRFTLKSLFGHL